ncbi:MAG TPA: alpha/beta hydrolase [Chthoniobacteraceae bacterium]|nr:alpha/beta hydrolase [Chthoniobacteraceae bacterium]
MNIDPAEQPCVLHANPAIGERGDLHLYLPESPRPAPFVLGIHGGGWSRGDQSAYTFLWPKLRPLGIGLVLASYRLAPEHPFPAAYDDLLFTLRWLSEHGAEHQLDTGRCALFGGSAGGHLTMLLASRASAENQPRPTLRGIAQYCGIMDTAAQWAWDGECNSQMTRQFLTDSPEEAPERHRAASPLHHLHTGMPPVWMAHGSADPTVPFQPSLQVADRLRALGHDIIFHEARGLGHTLCDTAPDGKNLEPIEILFERDLLRFFHRTLKCEEMASR